MRWTRLVTVITFLAGGLILSGCGKGSRPQADAPADDSPAARIKRPALPPGENTGTVIPAPGRVAAPAPVTGPDLPSAAVPAPDLSPQERYDAALLDALNLLAEHKPAEALIALEKARAAQDTEQVRQQIDRLRARIDQQQAADRTVQDIQTVLKDGKPDEAARLATAGLQQYGGGDAAESLTQLKREADALTAAGVNDQTAQRDRCRREAEAALQDQNLRAAALAFEQTLRYGEDAVLRRRLDEVRSTLARYDDNRRRAAELRRDPANLEDALAALQEATRAWDTPQVRQEIDEYTLALQKRRDRLSVADFEVRGDIGIPAAGRTVAEELLPAFRPRFDLVERSQLGRVVEELKLEASGLADNEAGQREVGRLANLRYLVLGSITVLNGVTVNARLVDVRSGLIVQTAQIVARTPEELLPRLPELANLLQMSDEQKMAFAQQLAQQCAPPPPAPVVVALPPPPEAGQPVPPPLIVYTPRPPDFGGLRPADFEVLPPPGPPAAVVLVEREDPVRQRLLNVSIELGDNLFRRGRYREAHAQFQLALNLSPHHQEIALRIENCRPHLPPPPPPPPVVVQPVAPLVVVVAPVRPRIAVLNFVVNADPGLVPPAFGDWATEQVASYFTPAYEVVERGEVCWYMGRLGVTMRDVLVNPSARVCLGRALNVRFFVFGAIQQTASFDVSTHLVDVESGAKQGGGKIHVQDHQELKLRIGELVQQTRADPAEQNRLQAEAKETEKVLNEARALYQKGQAEQAAAVCREGLKRWPNHAGLQALLQQAEQQVRQARLDQERQRALAAQQAQAAALQKRQQGLAREAEAARQRAEKAATARTEAERRAQEAQRQKAYDDLVAGGRRALRQGNYPQAVQQLQSAVALKPSDAGFRELALARAKADEAARQKPAEEQARREAALRQQHEAELTRVRQQVAEEQRKKQAEEQARRKAQETHDQAAYAQLLNQGRQQLAQGTLDAASASFQSARQLNATREVDDLLKQTHDRQALAAAQKQGTQAQAELERRRVEEKAARDRAEAQAKKNQELYNRALAAAQKAMAEKRYDEALAKYQEAGKVFHTDVVLNGMRQAEEARAGSLAQARRQQEDRARLAKYRTTLETGKAHLAARRYHEAVAAFTEAVKLNPADPAAGAALREAQQARDAAVEAAQAAEARKREEALRKAAADAARQKQLQEEQARAAQVRQWLTSGRNALNAGQLDAAAKAFAEAGKLTPADPAVKQALQDLDQARKKIAARPAPPPDPRRAEFNRLLTQGKAAMTAKKYDEAVKAFTEALKLQPGDPGATAALKEANQALQASKAPPPPKR